MHIGLRHWATGFASLGVALLVGAGPWVGTAAAADQNFPLIHVGAFARSLAVNPLTNRLYVANAGPNATSYNVAVIDALTNAVVATVPLGFAPVNVAVDASNDEAYVTGEDPLTRTLQVAIIVSGQAWFLNDWGPVGLFGPNPPTGGVNPDGPSHMPLAIDPVGLHLYVADVAGGRVLVTGPAANGQSVPTISVGAYPTAMDIDAARHRLYVVNTGSHNVSVIDTQANGVIATIPVGQEPDAIAVNPKTNRIFVTNYTDQTVSVIDGAANTVVATLAAGAAPYGVAADPVTNRIVIANAVSPLVAGPGSATTIIDTAHNLALPSPPLSRYGACAVAVNPASQRAYVSLCSEQSVAVLPNDGVALLPYSGPTPQLPVSVGPVPTGQVVPLPTLTAVPLSVGH